MDRIVVASHITPCGRSWIDNLLITLRIKWSYTESFDGWVHIWDHDIESDTHRYRHRDKPQGFVRKYCPAVMSEDAFRFRNDLEAISVHTLPRHEWRPYKKIYVVRNFKNSLISAFKRRSVIGARFSDYVEQLDPDLMLPLYYALQYHAESWLRQDRVHLVRQEDYRTDPEREIDRLIHFLDIAVSADMRARAIETALDYVPTPTEVEPEWEDTVAMIEARCRSTLVKLGYGVAAPFAAAPRAPDPRGFVNLALSCGIHADADVWSGFDEAEEAAGVAHGGGFADISAFLAPVTDALLNLRLREDWRAIYGQPVGERRVRGNMNDAMRFVDNAEALIRRMALDLRQEPR